MKAGGTDGLLNSMVGYLGNDADPPTPSLIVAASRALDTFCEELEHRSFLAGRAAGPDVDVEAWVGGLLDVLEEKAGKRLFNREEFDEVLAGLNRSGRRGSLSEVQRPLAFETPPFAAGAVVVDGRGGAWRYVVVECLRDKDGWRVMLGADGWLRPADLFLATDQTPVGHVEVSIGDDDDPPADAVVNVKAKDLLGHEAQPMPCVDAYGDPLDRNKHDAVTRMRRSVHGVICCPCCLSGAPACRAADPLCCALRRKLPYFIEYNKPGEGPISQAGRVTPSESDTMDERTA